MKLNGFTFAEVLTTLVIIGVLFTLTVPLLYVDYTRNAATSKLKTFFSAMNKTMRIAELNNHDWNDYYIEPESFTADLFLNDYILPYVIYAKTEAGSDGNTNVILNNATSFSISSENNCMIFLFDINNVKAPNVPGKDQFYFQYCAKNNNDNYYSQGKFQPYDLQNIASREEALSKCTSDPKFCASFLSFDYFHFKKDYPYRIPI